MHGWHLTDDAPRTPRRVSAGETVEIHVGTWPIAPRQSVWLVFEGLARQGHLPERAEARWQYNEGVNSHWVASVGPFGDGDQVRYTVHTSDGEREFEFGSYDFTVGPKLYLSLLWHHHQPMYGVPAPPLPARLERAERYAAPWVRLHALRDYYSMASLVAEHSDVHVTFNFSPSLLLQLEGYALRQATDRALELTRAEVDDLTPSERSELLATFFDADWHNQIFPHPRYRELFELRAGGRPLARAELQDLQMWFNLAWFGVEFRTGSVVLATGETCSVERFVRKGSGYSRADILAMLDEQYRILRAIIPLHARLQDVGHIEVSVTPLYHPILPLLMDTREATLDHPASHLPEPFAWPEDADEQVAEACQAYRVWFGRSPRGMWPAEGAVSQGTLALYARAGVTWIATDGGVLARSGQWGYEAHRPDVLCQARRALQGGLTLAVFFRDTELSDAIGFRYSTLDPERAVDDLVHQLRSRFINHFEGESDRIVSIVLDGENAWGGYAHDGRPFLRALYERLAQLDAEIRTVTFSEWLAGNAVRGVRAHAVEQLESVCQLFTGSWIDETGSAPGVDLGTWIGEREENRAWALLTETRSWLAQQVETAASAPQAFAPMFAAEGSDWFWWYGADQDSGNDELFDRLFREHLESVYRALGVEPPEHLRTPIIAPAALWTFVRPLRTLPLGARLAIRTQCPGVVRWTTNGQSWRQQPVSLMGGVLAGARHHQATLGPFSPDVRRIEFEFQCGHAGCPGHGPCCSLQRQYVAHEVMKDQWESELGAGARDDSLRAPELR